MSQGRPRDCRAPGSRRGEGNDPVGDVMADIGGAEEGDARALAPIAREPLAGLAEVAVILGYIAQAAEADPGAAPHRLAGDDVAQRAVGPVEMRAITASAIRQEP